MGRPKKNDLIPGAKFGLWTVIERRGGKTLCRCVCGTESLVFNMNLRGGGSLGCKPCRMNGNENNKFVRGSGIPKAVYKRLAQCVVNVRARCTDESRGGWDNYGGRGITLYEPWKSDVGLMISYLVTLPGHDDPTLVVDRINNDGNYEPGNLRFVNRSVSSLNRRKFGHLLKKDSSTGRFVRT